MSDPIFPSYLTAPWKAEYILKRKATNKDPNQCTFCAIAKLTPGIDSLEIFRDEFCIILLNKYPYNPGHLLLLPIDHYEDITLIPSNIYSHLGEMIQRCVKLLQIIYNAKGFNIGLNMGKIAGASISHLHWHIVPRFPSDLNFMEILSTRVMIETLNQTLTKLRQKSDIFTN